MQACLNVLHMLTYAASCALEGLALQESGLSRLSCNRLLTL